MEQSEKLCGYCGKPITGAAIDIPDHSDRSAHAPAYWHRLGDPDCWRARPRGNELPHLGGIRVDRATYRRATGQRAT